MQTKFGWCNFTFHKKDIFAITEVSQCNFRRSTSNSHRCPNTHLWVILPSPKTVSLIFLYLFYHIKLYLWGFWFYWDRTVERALGRDRGVGQTGEGPSRRTVAIGAVSLNFEQCLSCLIN